ncbi:MAG: nucleotidyltransferase family protein [Rhodospirillaceae bacterium]|nr:nucleotidyltransferase family protein [Rhodospirillaceae bacterium]
MNRPAPTTAMLLAAGLGTRMRPLSDRTPKPLIPVAGKALIDWCLDQAAAAGIATAVVNVHHLADQIVAHCAARATPRVVISNERVALLDTGGGIVKALPLLGSAPFLVMNTDGILTDGAAPALSRLFATWQRGGASGIDCAMLVHPREAAHGFDGAGDFFIEADGRLRRRGGAATAPFVYAGAYVIDPVVFSAAPDGAFSMNLVWDRLIAAGRMIGVIHDGAWFHVGTPETIAPTATALARMGAAR